MNNFNFQKITDADIAVEKITETINSKFIAGDTTLIDLWKYDLEHPEDLLDINSIQSINKIARNSDGEL